MAGWNYRKRMKIAPGVHLNVSKKGVSTSIGGKGASVTMGPNGTYLNTSVPGTGMYKRQKIGDINPSNRISSNPKQTNPNNNIGVNFGCSMVIIGIGSVILGLLLDQATICIGIGICIVIVGFIVASFSGENTTPIGIAKSQFMALDPNDDSVEANIVRARYSLLKNPGKSEPLNMAKDVPEAQMETYKSMVDVFSECMDLSAIWQVLSSESTTNIKASASTLVTRSRVFWRIRDDKSFLLPAKVPALMTMSDGMFYLYPSFVVHYINENQFYVYEYNEVSMSSNVVRFQESESVGHDVEVVDKTWRYINKNGGPDHRFADNPIVQVVNYGRLVMKCGGKEYTFHTSRYTWSNRMVDAFMSMTKRGTVEVSSKDSRMHLQKPELSRSYFIDVKNCVDKILDFEDEQILSNPICMNNLRSSNISISNGGKEETDIKRKLQYLILFDMIKGHLAMNHKLNTKDSECFGLFYYYYSMNGNRRLNYEHLSIIDQSLYDSANSLLSQVVNNTSVFEGQNTRKIVLRILEGSGKDVAEEFKVLMYRYYSLTAKSDGVVTDIEKDFMSKIIRQSKNKPIENHDDSLNDSSLGVAKEDSLVNTTKKTDLMNQPVVQKRKSSLEQLEGLVGLTNVKKEVTTLSNFIRIQQLRSRQGLKSSTVSYHCVFTGNPGTGKTTVARIVANIYKELGLLKKGHLVETDRSGLVAEYVGQTAAKTNMIIDSALDGVLFIDEAYSLVGGGDNDYGKEAISTLLKRMEDDRDRLVVILAGYSDEMKAFIDTNPGLQSRFNRYIKFPDYEADELLQIYENNLKKFEYSMSEVAKCTMLKYFEDVVKNKDKNFGNARMVRNVFEKTIERQANRLAGESNLDLNTLTKIELSDLPI